MENNIPERLSKLLKDAHAGIGEMDILETDDRLLNLYFAIPDYVDIKDDKEQPAHVVA